MKASEATLLDFLRRSPQFVIPIYQRSYSWTEAECQKLWNDVLSAGRSDKVASHFIGSVVYIESGLYQVTAPKALLVIDGQQRLTTATLLIEAVARRLGDSEPLDDFSALKLRSYFLKDAVQSGDRAYKLVLSDNDRTTLKAIIDSLPAPQDLSIRVSKNFELFTHWLASADIVEVCKGLAKLMIVDISLDRAHDDPQLIFESLNSTGRELSQADLIRNYVLMGHEPEVQTRLYETYWRPMERRFGQEAYASQFDSFMRHYLTLKTGEIPNLRDVYKTFKSHAHERDAAAVEVVLHDLGEHAKRFCRMALGQEPDKALAAIFADIRDLRAEVTYPFLLDLYADYEAGLFDHGTFKQILRLVETYVFRRNVCEIPTNSHNRTFAGLPRAIRKDRYLDSVKASFLLMPAYRRLPEDDEFRRAFERRDLYNFRNASFWLRRMENFDRKERVPVEDYTIEHIMPQNENVSTAWQDALGPEWQRVHGTYLHTLGNLTLTAYNSEYSDRDFSEKKGMEGGFAESPLRLNHGLAKVDIWNEAAIIQRAQRLSAEGCKVWPAPVLAPAIIDEFRPGLNRSAPATDAAAGEVGTPVTLLLQVRERALALDPNVAEQTDGDAFVYRAEEVVARVQPTSKGARIVIAIPHVEVQDTRGLCRETLDERFPPGQASEFDLVSDQDIEYAAGLLRQAFEWQMEAGGEA